MMAQTYYLNESGSRCRTLGQRVRIFDHGVDIGTRSVDFEEAFGNFGVFHFRIRGVRYAAFPRTFDRDDNGNAVCDIDSMNA